jgi:hypothetical protein
MKWLAGRHSLAWDVSGWARGDETRTPEQDMLMRWEWYERQVRWADAHRVRKHAIPSIFG